MILRDLDAAMIYVEEILDYLKTKSLDTLEPYLTCYHSPKENQDLRAPEVINIANDLF